MMAKIPVEANELAAGFHLVHGPGGNIAVLGGPDGLIVVDSGVPMRANEVLETVKRVGGKPVSRLINTHWHFDHAGGNEVFARACATILATEATRKRLATDQYTEVFKMTTKASPPAALPTLTSHESKLHVGGETIHLTAVPPAHTDGDLIVHFTSLEVIHTGDLFTNGFYPRQNHPGGDRRPTHERPRLDLGEGILHRRHVHLDRLRRLGEARAAAGK